MQFSKSLVGQHLEKQGEISRRALMGFPVDSDLDQQNQTHLAQEIAALTEVTVYESPTTGLRLPIDHSFPANMLYYFLVGDYEEHDMQLIRRYVKPGDRVLELGGGVGLTGSLLGQVSGNPVSVCEPNPALHAQIERTFSANGAKLKLFKLAATADHEPARQITFYVCKEYWWSSLIATENADPVTVPTKRLSTLIAETRANTLLVDIEGYEVALFADTKSLSAIKTVMVELHTPSIGTAESARIISTLVKAGFSMVDFGGHTFVFTRPEKKEFRHMPDGRFY
jgi:FkbM family methyltransferase